MSKTSTDPARHALNGPTMGTRWSALFHMPPSFDTTPVATAMAAAVAEVDAEMSTWKPDSDLMRLNRARPNVWVEVPDRLMVVLDAALAVGRASGGAFDIGLGDAVSAWGFGPVEANAGSIRAALSGARNPAHEVLELDSAGRRARKHAPMRLDLSGIAKGYGVDLLADVAKGFGIHDALVAIDGELRGSGLQPHGEPWTIAVERPDPVVRTPHAIIVLHDAAVATSGDYRHWVEVGGRRFSHTMDPWRGAPLQASPASVTVIADTCMAADAWATALMVLGSSGGAEIARRHKIEALFIERVGDDFSETQVGWLFAPQQGPVRQGVGKGHP